MIKLTLILIFFNFLYFSNCSDSTLKLVQVIFRHGSRMPDEIEVYPNDPHLHMFKHNFGQLTNKGKQESYQLGKILRTRYHNFLGESFHPNVVMTNLVRTQMTAMLVLAGLFPPYNDDKWSDELNWLPIPITYEMSGSDYELSKPETRCPKFVEELNKVLNSKAVLDVLKKYNETLKILTKNTKKNYNTLDDIFMFCQTIFVKQYIDLPIPSWALAQMRSLQYLSNMKSYFENYNLILKRLSGGLILKNIITNIKENISKTLETPKKKIILYSGHERNIISILSILQSCYFDFPKFNSAILFELHQYINSTIYFVKVFYLEDVRGQPKPIYLKGCGYSCNFTSFHELILPYLPVNYTKECERSY